MENPLKLNISNIYSPDPRLFESSEVSADRRGEVLAVAGGSWWKGVFTVDDNTPDSFSAV